DMIQKGAQEFVIKNYTDEEELFRRVLFAIEKHRRTVRVPLEDAASIHQLEKSKARMLTAHEDGDAVGIQKATVATTYAIADLSKKMFTELQTVNSNITKQGLMLEDTVNTSNRLKAEILEGHPDHPSMRSQVEVLTSRVSDIERREKGGQVRLHPKAPRTRLILATLIVIGNSASAGIGSYFGI